MTDQRAAILTTHDLTIGYRGAGSEKTVAANLNLRLHPGELVCLLGPNGAGKSTLLRTLAGMQPALSGHVLLGGQPVGQVTPRDMARLMSIVLTGTLNVGVLSAYELAALGRHPYTGWLGRMSERDHRIVHESLAAVGATKLAHRTVGELSDGERQKVLIARALAQQPAVMLLDEPTAFLDLPHRVEIMRTLRALAHRSDRALLLSTHDLDLALRSADRIWLMAADGSVHVGAPEDLVLNGAFQRTFEREGIEFDTASGSFTIEQPGAGVVHLSGEGVPALWTERALRRAGYRVTQNGHPAPVRVQVSGQNGSTRWQVRTPDQTYMPDSIDALIRTLDGAQIEAAR